MDSYAIASAIATRLGGVTPPSGEEAIKVKTADLPEGISVFPTLVVGHPSLADPAYFSKRRSLPLVFPVLLFLARHDASPRRAKRLHDWVTAIYGRLSGQLQLGLSTYVAWAEVDGFDAGVVRYEGIEYDGISLRVLVRVEEASGAAA